MASGKALTAAAIITALAVAPSVASAWSPTFLSPSDGDTVTSRPPFTVDGGGPPGSVTSEVATDPTVLTGGDRAGAFVEPVDGDVGFFGDDPTLASNVVVWGPQRLDAGRYFWHAVVDMYDGRGESDSSPILRFTVGDEPVRSWKGGPPGCARFTGHAVAGRGDSSRAPSSMTTTTAGRRSAGPPSSPLRAGPSLASPDAATTRQDCAASSAPPRARSPSVLRCGTAEITPRPIARSCACRQAASES